MGEAPAIKALEAEWVAAELAGDADRLRALMTRDVTLCPPDGAAIRGADAVTRAIVSGEPPLSIEITDRATRCGSRHGWKTARFQTRLGDGGTVSGSHVWMLHAQPGGPWRITAVSWLIDPS